MRALLLILALLAPPASADSPPAGLMWNRSGLPATLPLILRTDADRDAYLRLRDPDGTARLAAFVQGGQPFRLLVPPGDWQVDLALGQDWQGEDDLFGPDTERLSLPGPLRFAAGDDRRDGHLIDLRGGEVRVSDRALCQTLRLDPESLRELTPIEAERAGIPPRDRRFPTPDYEVTTRLCD
ncbi:hypothetical protein [Frigidibacter oleivorans]|uniref:hypothetical protein n=1 Tax=Frigidibacter oleivorans TaxID=2487129 RepID=UPI000F8CE86B|nr:hypothetical protein [Frigidibacter oleivorans]